MFNQLSIKENSNISLIEKKDILSTIKKKIENKISFHIVNY
jgi:hypothetical protein